MKRLWNDGWFFLKTAVGTSMEQARERGKEFAPVDLPHDWLIYDAQNLYEDGTGWYRKTFERPDAGLRAALFFEGVYMNSAVYINGKLACEWKYGYSSFTVELTDFLRDGENEALVKVCFQSPNSRWYSGAGIYRDVWLVLTEQTYLDENEIYISTKKRGERDFLLRVDVGVMGAKAAEASLAFRLLDESNAEVPMDFMGDGEYLVETPALWDVKNPVLYRLEISLFLAGRCVQTLSQRFGFRETVFDPEKGFFLNGRHLKLNGVCEHHDLGALGAAFNRSAMERKFRILKEMGVNAVRGAHNMMAPGFVELADEMGILLISEAFDMWERPKTTYDYARFFPAWSARDVESWVKRDRNHPSVILWSIGNEIYDTHADGRGREITVYLKDLVERFDPAHNARVTLASNYMPWENAQNCADVVKIAGYNYSEKYYGEHHKRHPDWVIYGSETSSIVQSRGVYHFPLGAAILSDDDEQCSALGNSATSWGAKFMEECIALDRDTEFSMGQFLWTGFDYIGEPTPYHTKNSYFGQIDTAGFPKDSYYVWQAAWTDYREKPMVHVFPYWDFNEGQRIDVRVCSNAPFVELFLNGESQGRERLSHDAGSGRRLIADYQLAYEKGVLCAVAYDEDGREVARQERRSFGNSERIVIRSGKDRIRADGKELLFLEIGTVDAEGNPVENACDRVCVSVHGAGRLVGLDNGDSTDFDSYKGTSRRLFNGKLLAIVQAALTPGEIVVTVTGDGLKTAAKARFLCVEAEDSAKIGVSAREKNRETAVVTGRGEIPVRRITLLAPEGRTFSEEKRVLHVEAVIEPHFATDQSVWFAAVNAQGVPSNLVRVVQDGKRVALEAVGDGMFYLRCLSASGTKKARIISQLEFSVQGLGAAYLDPYGFISGSLYAAAKGEVGSGNERGVATARDGETVVIYRNIDFGKFGSDEITIPIFALDDKEYPMQIWEGVPNETDAALLADVVYQKPSIWNVYQPETYQLNKMLTGVRTLSFVLWQKVHIKGFSFRRYEKAWMRLSAAQADAIYGDSFTVADGRVEQIGNNVTLVFSDMDFGGEGANLLTIRGRAGGSANTVHVRFYNGADEIKQIVEFPKGAAWQEQRFPMERVAGKWEVSFVFLPGSCFDFDWFLFGRE